MRRAISAQIGLRTPALPRCVPPADLGALGAPLPPPPEECRPAGRLHSPARDAVVVSHHYDVGNDFYRLVLGPSMTYSCARFVDARRHPRGGPGGQARADLPQARSRPSDPAPASSTSAADGDRWPSTPPATTGREVVGVTLSREQVDEARRRVARGRVSPTGSRSASQDYRDLRGEQLRRHLVDRHVRARRHGPHGRSTSRPSGGLLGPTGRLLNHAISKPGGSTLGRRTFIGRYVFPDGELLDVAEVVGAMQRTGFEVRDVESLREHYSRTLHHWVANLEADWDEAVGLVGPPRANVWRLYMAASANGFDDGGLAIHQVLGVVPDADGPERHAADPGGMGMTRPGTGPLSGR